MGRTIAVAPSTRSLHRTRLDDEVAGEPRVAEHAHRHYECFCDAVTEASLALPMAHRNAQLLAVLTPGLELAVAEDDAGRTLVDDVRLALSETISGDRPAIGKVAKSLGMSIRTLQRHLGELGTTYQDILDEVRQQLARRLLANTELEMGEVAFLLGFEEVNSFVRAFHAWEGTTPAKWRASASARAGAPQGKRRVARIQRARSSSQST